MSVDRTVSERRPGGPPVSTQPKPRMTPQEYLAAERRAEETKHEYHNGEIFAMSGASARHNIITANLIGSLVPSLRGGPCRVYASDMRLKVEPGGLYTYPDVAVVCDKPLLEDEHFDTLLNPTLLIEVQSPSTERYDRSWKAPYYRALDSLQDLLLISQEQARVEQYARQSAQQWLLTEIRGLDARVELTAVPCVLRLSDIYDNVLTEAARG
jgi:Uma2 family endonuclease